MESQQEVSTTIIVLATEITEGAIIRGYPPESGGFQPGRTGAKLCRHESYAPSRMFCQERS